MAALGICMVIVGAVAGFGVLLLWQRRKNRQFNYRSDLNSYTNM